MRQVNGKELITGCVRERRILTSHSTSWTYCGTGDTRKQAKVAWSDGYMTLVVFARGSNKTRLQLWVKWHTNQSSNNCKFGQTRVGDKTSVRVATIV